MAWVVTNPNIYTTFALGTFENNPFVATDSYIYPLEAINPASFTRFTGDSHAGAACLKIVTQNGAYGSGGTYVKPLFKLYPRSPVTAGKRYTASGWIKVTSAPGGPGTISVQGQFRGSGAVGIGNLQTLATSGVWTHFVLGSVIESVSVPDSAYTNIYFEVKLYATGMPSVAPLMGIEILFDDFVIQEETELLDPLEVDYTKTDATAAGAADGTISLLPSGGLPPYTYLWGDGPITQNRIGLSAGTYTVAVTDSDENEVDLSIDITEPGVIEDPLGDYIFVPQVQSLRFVKKAVIDHCSVMPTMDNTLYCERHQEYITHWPFYQKVAKCDVITEQFHSNYPINTVKLFTYNEAADLVKEFTPVLKQQFTGIIQQFNISIVNHGAGKSRVYFAVGGIPIPLSAGDIFQIVNNLDGFNGAYEILSIQNDVFLGSQYLLITLNYTAGTPASAGVGNFTTSVVNFNVFEVVINLGDVPNGLYFMEISGNNPDDGINPVVFDKWTSEPINLKIRHLGTHLLEWRCADNSFDVYYPTGIMNRMRVESHFYQAIPGGKDENFRQSNYTPVKLSGKASRKIRFEIFRQPDYRIETISVALRCDVVKINGVEYFTEEGLGEAVWGTRYALAKATAIMEQKTWFKEYNGDDLGSVEGETGFLIVNNGFLKVSQ